MNYVLIILLTIFILFLYWYRHDVSSELSNIEKINNEIKIHNYMLYYNEALEIYEKNIDSTITTGSSSKGERATKCAIESIMFVAKKKKYVFDKIRHPEIINPMTNKSLEIDCYNKELKLGLEYNGEQHYFYNDYFHKKQEEYKKQLSRDETKRKRCKELGITLIEIPHIIKHKDILLYICLRLNESYI